MIFFSVNEKLCFKNRFSFKKIYKLYKINYLQKWNIIDKTEQTSLKCSSYP